MSDKRSLTPAVCPTCSGLFHPRKGQVYCSRKCSVHTRISASLAPEVVARRLATLKARISSGEVTYKTGPESPRWVGGKSGEYQRNKASYRDQVRRYRANNPEKVREFSQRRAKKRISSLPRGTVTKLLNYQRRKCAVCRVDLSDGYHVDHITPLAKGGEHAPDNIQILCPSCNCQKSAKDPIAFMQSRGFLL